MRSESLAGPDARRRYAIGLRGHEPEENHVTGCSSVTGSRYGSSRIESLPIPINFSAKNAVF
jgi:hypothetical protein